MDNNFDVVAKKAFAKAQLAWLLVLGFNEYQAFRIMKACGPGLVRRAVEYAHEAYDAVAARIEKLKQEDGVGHSRGAFASMAECEAQQASLDALDLAFANPGGSKGFGIDRQIAALRMLGLPTPNEATRTRGYKILAGAHAAVLAGLPAKTGRRVSPWAKENAEARLRRSSLKHVPSGLPPLEDGTHSE